MNSHYLAKFQIRRWANDHDKVWLYTITDNGLKRRLVEPGGAGFKKDLYTVDPTQISSQYGDDASRGHIVETGFLTPEIDTPAARVLKQIEVRGLGSLTEAQRQTWLKYVMAQAARVESSIERIKQEGVKIVQEELGSYVQSGELTQDELQRIGHTEGLMGLKAIVESPKIIDLFQSYRWGVREIESRSGSFLLGDRPFYTAGGIYEGDALLIMPIGPHRLFYAASTQAVWEDVNRASDQEVVLYTNQRQVWRAQKRLIADSDAHGTFIHTELKHRTASDR